MVAGLTAPDRPVAHHPPGESAGSRFSLTFSSAVGLIICLIGFVIGGAVLADNSLLTHVATGRLILDGGSVPNVDPYSSTGLGRPWTVQSWLISTVYAVADRAVGMAAVRLLHAVVAGLIAGLVWQLTASARQVVTRLALTLLPLLIGIGLWSPRPLMFGLLAIVALLQIRELDRPMWLVVPLMWLWANSHGSYPLALVLVFTLVIGGWLDDRRAGSSRRTGQDLKLLGLVVVGTLSAVIGPLGLGVLWFPVRLLSRRQALEGVEEWAAPSFQHGWEWLFLALIPLLTLAATRSAGWRILLPSIVFTLSGLLAVRNIAVASLVVVVLVAPALRDLVGTVDGSASGPVVSALGKAAVIGLACAAVAVAVSPAVDLDRYPVVEVDHLEDRGIVPRSGAGFIHREAVGNYLTYRYGAEASVFIDDRFDFHALDVTEDHLQLVEGGDFGEVLQRREAEVVLWPSDTPFARWLHDNQAWNTLELSPEWVIACRPDTALGTACLP